jgi:hypothetical protein
VINSSGCNNNCCEDKATTCNDSCADSGGWAG